MRDNETFRLESAQIAGHFPGLQNIQNENGETYVAGDLRLEDTDGTDIDTYSIRIVPTEDYPFRFPHVFETAGRIPVNIDWHVFPDSHCCIKTFPEELLLCKSGITLPWFVETQVKPYFFNQKYRELHGFFLKERAHGGRGIVEFFEDAFGTKNLDIIIHGIQLVKNKCMPNRVSLCFCGNGLKYRKCHRSALQRMAEFTDQQLGSFLSFLVKKRDGR